MVVTKDDFIKKDDAEYVEVDVEPYGTVRLKSMSGKMRSDWYEKQYANKGEEIEIRDLQERLVAICLCDEEGNRFFEDDVEQGVAVVREKSAGIITKLFEACLKLNGMSADDVEEAAENLG